METEQKLPKGIRIDKKSPDKYIAQYWNKELQKTIYIGVFDSIDDAVYWRRDHICKVYDGEIDDSLPKTKLLPKGIVARTITDGSERFDAGVDFSYGKRELKRISIHVGTYETVEDAVQARIDFIENLK